jgi:hypothetical protein
MANNPPAPNDISAAGVTTVAGLITAFNDRLRTIRAWVTGGYVASPATATIDVNNQTVINVPDPSDPQDAVNLRTLKRMQAPAAADQPPSVGGVSFRAVARGYAELSIEDLAVAGASQLDAVEFIAWAVDETDIGLNAPIGQTLDSATGSATIDNPFGLVAGMSTDPAATPSRLKRTITAGDMLYIEGEVVRVMTVGTSSFTVDRSGWLASSLSTHDASARWYKLCPFPFTAPARPSTKNMPGRLLVPDSDPPAAVATSGVPSRWDFAAPNLAVVAIAAAALADGVSGPVKLTNYTPSASNMPKVAGVTDFTGSPGLRTCSGAAYTDIGVGGTLTTGGYADFLARVQAWHSIRNVYGYLNAAAGAPVRVAVLYYSPDRTQGGVIATIAFSAGDILSQPVATADGVQMPVGVWPPNLLAPIAMSGGRATFPIASAGTDPVIIEAGGWLDIVVVLDGGAAALTVVVAV